MAGGKKQSGTEGILAGIAEVLGKLGELAEKGEQLKKTGHFQTEDKTMDGVYGFSFKYGAADKQNSGPTVEPFGNVRRDSAGSTYFDEVREPLTDVFEEEDSTLIVLEMPGIEKDDITLSFTDTALTIEAARGKKKYKKEVVLRTSLDKEKTSLQCNNGIVELRCFP